MQLDQAIFQSETHCQARETKLAHREAQWQLLVENTLDVIYTFDIQTGIMTFVNPAVARWGVSPDEIIGQPFAAFVHPDDLDGVLQDMQRTITTGEEFLSQFRIVTPHGDIVPVEEFGKAIREDGEVVQITGVLRDVTERLQAEAAVQASEKRFRTLIEHSADAIALLGADGAILYASPAVSRINGYPSAEFMGQNGLYVVHPDDLPSAENFFQQLLREPGVKMALQFRLQHRDGSYRWIDATAQNLLSEPDINAVVVNYRDINEQKQAEEAVRESEKLYHSLFEHMLNGLAYCRILYTDGQPDDFIYLAVNHAFATQTGLKGVVGRKVSEVIPGFRQDDPHLFETYCRVATTGRPEHVEIFVVSLRMWFSIMVYSPARDHFFAVFDVVTQRKQTEEEREQLLAEVRQHSVELSILNNTLEQQVKQRTAELTETNRALCESEAMFRMVVDASPAGIFVVQNWRHIFVNASAAQLTGYSREELLDLPLGALVPPDAYALMIAYARARLTGMPVPDRYEMPFITKHGENRWADFSPCLINFDGQPAIMATVIDITDRKQAEEALKSSECRFRELAELAPVGIFLGDGGRKATYINQRWSDITGWPRGQGLGTDWTVGIHPDDRAEVERGWEIMLREHRECHQEYRYLTPEGAQKWIIVNKRPLLDATGAMTGFVGTVLDITDRKQAEARVQQLHQRVEQWAAEMDAAITAIADGIVILGVDAEIIRINHAAEEIFGYTPEIEARPFSKRQACLQCESANGIPMTLEEHASWRALHGETIHGMIMSFTRNDGQRRWVSISAAPIILPNGELLGAVATMSDITALRAMQQRQEELLHIVSHDLRIPLTVIHGHMELLEDTLAGRQIDAEVALNTSTINRNIRRMNVMIEDLVDMARLEGHQFALNLDTVYLQHYIPDLITRVQHVLPLQRVVTELPPDLPPARADNNRLERIMLNLLTNACKYSTPDTPVCLRVARQGNELVISVSDQGRGIDPNDLPHLFERFYRAGGERQADGIGLGLYITNLLVTAHGGQLRAESTVGQGSTFAFTLPIAG